MPLALLLVRLLLTGVFAVAGVTKLVDRAGSRQALRDFGVPAPLAAPFGVVLPLAELAIGVTLLPVRTAWGGALAALALFVLFIGGLSLALIRGRHPACHCFGQLSSAPVDWTTLARNAVLAGSAGFIVAAGRTRAGTDVLGQLGGGDVTAWIGVGFGVGSLFVSATALWLLVQLVAQNGRLLPRLEQLEQRLAPGGNAGPAPAGLADAVPQAGLPVGTTAPAFQLPGLHGEILTLEALRATGKPTLLAFLDPGCGPCNALLPDVARWQRELAGTVAVAVVSRGSADDNRTKVTEHGLSQVLLQQDREVSTAYQAHGTPSMVQVRPDGVIGSPLAQGAEQIRALVARTMGTPLLEAVIPVLPAGQPGQPCPNCGRVHGAEAALEPPSAVAIGQVAPALKLADLEGNTVDLADWRGRETLVLFWNPDCGFCQQMLPALTAWEAQRPTDAPALLVVSSGTSEATQAQGLRATVVLDPGFSVGPTFGANGTPTAVRVAATGAIASPPAAGAAAVFALLGGRSVAT